MAGQALAWLHPIFGLSRQPCGKGKYGKSCVRTHICGRLGNTHDLPVRGWGWYMPIAGPVQRSCLYREQRSSLRQPQWRGGPRAAHSSISRYAYGGRAVSPWLLCEVPEIDRTIPHYRFRHGPQRWALGPRDTAGSSIPGPPRSAYWRPQHLPAGSSHSQRALVCPCILQLPCLPGLRAGGTGHPSSAPLRWYCPALFRASFGSMLRFA